MRRIEELIPSDFAKKSQLPWFLQHMEPEIYLISPYLVFDFETTNIQKGNPTNPKNRIVAVSWYASWDSEIRYLRGNEFEMDPFLEVLESLRARFGFVVCHHAKFDLQWLLRAGYPADKLLCYDTMIGEYVLAGNRRLRLSLDHTAKRYGREGKGGIVDRLMNGGVCPSEQPPPYLKARAMRDVKDTLHIFLDQREELQAQGKLPLQFTRCLATPVLASIEMKGLHLDETRVMEEYERADREYQAVLREFNELTGGINPRSSPQMAKFIYGDLGFKELTSYGGEPKRNKASKKFPDGVPKVDEKTLNKLKATTQKQKDFIRLRKKVGKLNAQITKTLDFFKRVCEEKGGIFYGQFNQTVAQTHRLTSSARAYTFEDGKTKGIQLQNMARIFKDLISPKRKGYKIADHDGSQLEFRVAGFLGNDSVIKQNIRHDVDQHAFTARKLAGLSLEEWEALDKEVRKALRQGAKEHTFKPLYGGQRGTEAEMRYYQAFREEFPELTETQENWTYEVLRKGTLELPWRQTFHWPGTKQSNSGYIDNTTLIYNYPIQSLATAEIIPIALVYLYHRAAVICPEIEIINTVHDDVVAEIPEGADDIWLMLGAQTFTLDVYEYLDKVYNLQFDLPLGVGSSIGERWNIDGAFEREVNIERDGSWWEKGKKNA